MRRPIVFASATAAALIAVLFAGFQVPAVGEVKPIAKTDTKTALQTPSGFQAPQATGPKVDGLELPADLTVAGDEGFVTLQAACDGTVQWYVLGSSKVKFVASGNTLVVSIPPAGGVIAVLAVGQVKGVLTPFARCNITVTPIQGPPKPDPNPKPTPTAGKLFVTLVYDAATVSQAQADVLNSPKIPAIAGASVQVLKSNDAQLDKIGLRASLTAIKNNFALIVQNDKGDVVLAQTLPATAEEVLAVLAKLRT